MSTVSSKIHDLKTIVASDCEILVAPDGAKFREFTKRWTDIDRKIPVAIVLPRTEDDIHKIVQWALKESIPFVTKSGGGSEWSTIDDKGFVIDLTHYSAIEVNVKAQTAIIRGGITQKQAAVRLAEAGLFTALGNGNVVGVTGYCLVISSSMKIERPIRLLSDRVVVQRLLTRLPASGQIRSSQLDW